MSASALQANVFCDEILALADHQAGQYVTLTALSQSAKCASAIDEMSQRFVHCSWAFDYRAKEAKVMFYALQTALSQCPLSALEQFTDQGVNHPDSYDLKLFDYGGQEVGISLKDKGGLQQSYVFLRVHNPPS